MKTRVIIGLIWVLGLACSWDLAAAINMAKWQLVSEIDGVTSWRDPGNYQVTGQRQEIRIATSPQAPLPTLSELLAIHQTKQKVLRLIGVHNWQVDHSSLVWEQQVGIFRLAGTYQDRKNQTIYFLEVHYLRADHQLQLLYTAPVTWQNYLARGEEFIRDING